MALSYTLDCSRLLFKGPYKYRRTRTQYNKLLYCELEEAQLWQRNRVSLCGNAHVYNFAKSQPRSLYKRVKCARIFWIFYLTLNDIEQKLVVLKGKFYCASQGVIRTERIRTLNLLWSHHRSDLKESAF